MTLFERSMAGARGMPAWVPALVLPLAWLFAGASAHAQPAEDPALLATARGFAVEGVKLAQAGRCAEAIDKLERAEQLHHSPVVLSQLGACQIEQGRLVQGSEMLRAVLREPLPERSTPAVHDAYQRAESLLAATKPRIASLTLVVDAPGGVVPGVTLDGHDVPVALLGVARAIDPGEHTVEATAPGFASVRQQLSLQPGQARALPIYLQRVGPELAAVETPRDAPPSGTVPLLLQQQRARPAASRIDEHAAAAPSLLPVYVALGVSAVSLGVGIAFGWAALDDKAELDSKCPGGVCPQAYQPLLDSAKQRGVISTAAFGVGAASAVVGAVLYFTRGPEPTEAHASTAPSLRIGLGRAALGVAF